MTAHPDTPTGRATSLLAALTLAACSWQASATDADHGASDALAAEAAALLPPVSVPPPPPVPPDECSTLGQWGSVIAWTPHIPVSAAKLPDGRILTFASNQRTTFPAGAEFTYAATWTPSTGAFVEYNHPSHDMFCGALVTLPEDLDLLLWRAVLAERQGDDAAAADFLARARALPFPPSDVDVQLGMKRLQAGDLAGATAAADAVIQRDPELPTAYFILASVAEVQGERVAAIDLFEKAATLAEESDPQLAVTSRMRLGALLQLGAGFLEPQATESAP